jgi:hypothetical protein
MEWLDDIVDDEPSVERSWVRPLMVIVALLIILIFMISIVPLYSVTVSPPPDMDEVANFELTDAEKLDFGAVNYTATSRVQGAIDQVDLFDYRGVSTRLVGAACSSSSDYCYARAIFYYVRDMRYVSDPESRQYVQSPAETLLAGAGDCEDKALLLSAMLESIGMDSDVGVTSDHAFIRAQISDAPFWQSNDDYVWLDPATNVDFSKLSFEREAVIGWFEVAG